MADRENADKRKQHSPSNAAESADREQAAKAARDAMLGDIDRELAELMRVIGARRVPGVNDPHLDVLETKASDLQALRGRVEGTTSPIQLAQLKFQVTETVRATEAAVTISAASGSMASAHMSSYALAAESQRILVEGSRELQKSNALISSWGKQYGVDLSEQDKRERDLKKQEDEARAKGDIVGALGIHADRYENQIDGIDTLQDSGKVPEADMPKLDAKKKDLYKGLVTTLEQQAREARARGMQTDYIDKRLEDTKQAIERQYGKEEIIRIEASIDRRSDFKEESKPSIGTEKLAISSDVTADVKAALKKNDAAQALALTADTEQQNPFATETGNRTIEKVKQAAKSEGENVHAAGMTDSSAGADLKTGEKTASIPNANAFKPATRSI